MTSKTVAKAYSNGSSLLKLPPNNTFRIMVPFRNMCEGKKGPNIKIKKRMVYVDLTNVMKHNSLTRACHPHLASFNNRIYSRINHCLTKY